MKMKTKIILYITGCFLIGIASALLIIAKISVPYLESEETNTIRQDVDKASALLHSEIAALERTQRDWTWWDDTYYFINGENKTYSDDNLGQETLAQLNLVGMLFLDKGGNVIYSKSLDENSEISVQKVIAQKEILEKLLRNVDEKNTNSGITIINQKLFIVSTAGISTSDGVTPANGYLIMVKELDDAYISYMEEILGANIQYRQGASNGSNMFEQISLGNIVRNEAYIQYEGILNDVINNNFIVLEVESKRNFYEDAVETRKILISALVIVFIVISTISIIAINKFVISRILYLTKFVQDVILRKDMSLRMNVKGKDEIASLESDINFMLAELDKNYIEIKMNDEHLHLIMEATNDGYFDYDLEKGSIYINSAWVHYLGYTDVKDTTISMERAVSGIIDEDQDDFNKAFDDYLQNGTDIFHKELRAYKAYRGYIWILIRGRVVEFDKAGNAVRFVGSLSDITNRKEAEQQKVYLLQTDPVTSLKNRTFLENEIKGIDDLKNICILMADVNGLKLINDAFGHKEGDRLLNTVGEIIKMCCSDKDIPVRWGGDEFLILIRNSRQYADDLLYQIKFELASIDSFPIKISVAMGCSACRETDATMEQAICRAEEKMYRNKLLESRSFHNGVIASFEQTLYEKHIEEPEQINRRKKLCQKMGEILKLSPEVMDELDLLNLLHDVGKIALPDNIILKNEGLTEEESRLKKKHAESGYRIAKAIPEIAHIADSILYHHENFDGTGYPTGIAGEQIPINARIIVVINTYESLMNGESEQFQADIELVKQEMERKSGTQFDPEIVSAFLKNLL